MFDLEKAIAEGRQHLIAGGITEPEILDELESHLREDVERQVQSGIAEELAFTTACQRIGEAALLKTEFHKINRMNWNRPLAWSAWVLFAVSFFLPVQTGMWGWMCALSAAGAPLDLSNIADVHYLFLTLANLFMIASPLFLAKFPGHARVWKGVQFANIAAFIAVWTFFARLLTSGWQDMINMQVGYYAWTLSFLLLFLSMIRWRMEKSPRVIAAN